MFAQGICHGCAVCRLVRRTGGHRRRSRRQSATSTGYFSARRLRAWPVVFGFDLVAELTLALATMAMGVMGGFALVFVPAWIAFRRARSWRGGLVLAALIGLGAYVAAFLLALGLDQPFGPVLALLLIAVGLIIA